MNLEIIKETKNELLERTEIIFVIKGEKLTPARKELVKKIAALKNAKEEHIIVGNLEQLFGSTEVSGEARIYSSKEMLEKAEVKPIIARHQEKKKEEKTEEAPPAPEGEKKEAEEQPKEKEEKKEDKNKGE